MSVIFQPRTSLIRMNQKKLFSGTTNCNYAQPTAELQRFLMRLDGFASIQAGYDVGLVWFVNNPG